MFVVFLRVTGAILLLAGMAALGFDLWQYVQSSGQGMGQSTGQGFHLAAAGELWYRLSPGTLNLTQAVTQRYVLPELWDPVLLTVLLWPAFLVLAVPGLVLFALGSLRRR
ncbi:signal peptide protein [Skermanella aerolata KACC 11604]|nr:signal peptide protein [Skermanella aerolata KACC 11604]